MKITTDHLLDLIDELPKDTPFDYVIAGDNKAVLISVDHLNKTVTIEKQRAGGERKSAGMTMDSVRSIAESTEERVPLSLDRVFNGSGSSRSTWEAILANTREFYTCKVNNQKHIIWVPDSPHNIGTIMTYSGEFNEPSVDSNHVLENSIANYITVHDKEVFTFDELAAIYKNMRESNPYHTQVANANFYGILYAPHVADFKRTSEGSIAYAVLGNKEGSMGDEIDRGIKIGLELRKHLAQSHLSHLSGLDVIGQDESYDKFLRALRTKPFLLLAGISGTGKSRIVRELAFKSCPEEMRDKDGTTPGNYLMIEVKPNWHDSTDIMGYYSNIAKKYQYTKFIRFAVKATMHPEVPFFVCLDEMNLAPIEQYFAEFLSVLETRKKVGDKVNTGILVEAKYMNGLKDDWNEAEELKWDDDQPLTLPDNLFVIGTVNMDDTTHQFSRKVIDRAMTIEMNGGSLESMFEHKNELEYLSGVDIWKLDSFKPLYVTADEALAAHPSEADTLKKELSRCLTEINDALAGTPFQVSYRVLNELCIYAAVLLDDGLSCEEAISEAVDKIILMKILPRIEGDEDMFNLNGDVYANRLEKLMALFTDTSDSWKKLSEMNERLTGGSGFTRFWP